MPQYRVYIINSDGHFHNAVPLECPDDAKAMERRKSSLLVTTLSFGFTPAR